MTGCEGRRVGRTLGSGDGEKSVEGGEESRELRVRNVVYSCRTGSSMGALMELKV